LVSHLDRKIHIVFICSGNLFRSPVAEGFARNFGEDKLKVKSCGTIAQEGEPPAENAITIMNEYGIDISNQRSQPISPQVLSWADWIICMEKAHIDYIRVYFPEFISKTRLLLPGKDVEDPYASDFEKQKETVRIIKNGVEKLVQSIT